MRLVYVDEAGTDLKEPIAVVAAVIVDADRHLVPLERHLDRLVTKWVPESQRIGFVFHATELFNGTKRGSGKPFERDHPDWPAEKRWKIADDLAAILGKYKVSVTCGWVVKSEFPASPAAKTRWASLSPAQHSIAQHATAFSVALLKVDTWMRKHASNEVCLMIVEDHEQARSMLRETQKFQQTRDAALLDEEHRKLFPLRKIKEDPLFQPKRQSSALQMADFCAYVIKKYLMQDRRYDRYFNPLKPHIIELLKPSLGGKQRS